MFKKFTVKAMTLSLAAILMIPAAVPVLAEENPAQEYTVVGSEAWENEETASEGLSEEAAEEESPEAAGQIAEPEIPGEESGQSDEEEPAPAEEAKETEAAEEAAEVTEETAETEEEPALTEESEDPETAEDAALTEETAEPEAEETAPAEEAEEPETQKKLSLPEEGAELKTEEKPGKDPVEEVIEEEEEKAVKAALSETITSGEWQYEIEDGTAVLTGYIGGSKEVVIPSKIDGRTVTVIGYEAFENSEITSVTIPETVLKIESYAFYNCLYLSSIRFNAKNCTSFGYNVFYNAGLNASSLTVTFGKNLRKIPEDLFYCSTDNCPAVTKVIIPDNITEIGDDAFHNCKYLKTITWGSGVKTIGYGAFCNCESLTSLTLPAAVSAIGSYAFEDTGLKTLTIPKNVLTIGYDAFDGCVFLSKINFNAKNCKDMSSNVFRNAGANASSLTVVFGKGVERIPDDIFYAGENDFARVTKVTIPSTVKEIGDSAFRNCKNLKSVTIPSSVTSIESCAFENCTDLKNVMFEGRNTALYEWGNVFYGFDPALCLYCRHGSTIPEYAKKYGIRYEYVDLGQVQGVAARNVSPGVKISWKKYAGAAGYIIYRKNGSGSFEAVKRVTGGNTTAWTDTGVSKKNGTTYTYRVRAFKGDKKSGLWTNRTITRLTGVTVSYAKSTTYGKMTVKWTKNDKASGYQIQYSRSKSFASGNKSVTVKGSAALSKVLGKLTSGDTYYVRVRAYKTVSGKKNYSGWSKVKSVTVR